MYPVVAVVGPTGSGKSDLGLCLAGLFHGEVINCDSVQVHAGIDIGSAKTPWNERRDIAHHLLDVVSPAGELTAGDYAKLARAALRDIMDRHGLPIVVGGSGLYLRAFLEGLSPAPERDEALRERLQAKNELNPLLLPRFLRRFDPAAARRIHQNDRQKLIRAVELTMKGGQPATAIQMRSRDALTGIRVLKMGLNPDRGLLYKYLNQRTAAMFQNGLLEETENLLESGVPLDAKPLQTLGYKQAIQILQGGLSLSEGIVQCQNRTRQYAKRQLTWFRQDPEVQWLNGFGSEGEIQRRASALCRAFVEKL